MGVRLFYFLVAVVFISTFSVIISFEPETKTIHVVSYSSEPLSESSNHKDKSNSKNDAAIKKAHDEIALRQRPYDYEAVTTQQFLRERNAIKNGLNNNTNSHHQLDPDAPEICMASFIMLFHWSENPRGGQSVMGVYLYPEETGRPVHIFNSQYGKLRCRVDGRRMIWGNYNGRWRDHTLDSKITYEVDSTTIRITETDHNGSAHSSEFVRKKLKRLISHSSTKKRYLGVEQKLNKYKETLNSSANQKNRIPVFTNPVETKTARKGKNFLEEFQDNWKEYKQKERRKADRRTDQICDSVYDTFGSADEFFRGLKCKQDYRKQHRLIYE